MSIIGQEKPSLDDILAHHGVRGMKWGVRKTVPGSESQHSAPAQIKRHMTDNQKKALITASIVGAAALSLALKKHGGDQMTTVALPHLAYTDRNGQHIYDYTSGIARYAQVRVKDLPAHNANFFRGV